jgi:hypothetical protein
MKKLGNKRTFGGFFMLKLDNLLMKFNKLESSKLKRKYYLSRVENTLIDGIQRKRMGIVRLICYSFDSSTIKPIGGIFVNLEVHEGLTNSSNYQW